MSKANNLTEFLTDTANAIRSKKGYPSTQKINPQNFATEIASIQSGGLTGYYEKVPFTNETEVGVYFDIEQSSVYVDLSYTTKELGMKTYLISNGDEYNIELPNELPLFCFTLVLGGSTKTWMDEKWEIGIFGSKVTLRITNDDNVVDSSVIYVIIYNGYLYAFLG